MAYSEWETLRKNLIFFVTSSSKGDLTPFERLFIVNALSYQSKTNQGWLVDLYLRCGCFSEAKQIYESLNHWRTLGDLAWANDDLISAEGYYSRGNERRDKDWDRLIKLAFYKSEWKGVIDIVLQADIETSDIGKGNEIVLGRTYTSRQPYLKMLVLAIAKCGKQNDLDLTDKVSSLFGVDEHELQQLICSVSDLSNQELVRLQGKALPKVTKTQHLAYNDALKKGNTDRATSVARTINSIDTTCGNAVQRLKLFFKDGDETALTYIAEIINDFYDESLASTFLSTLTSKVGGSLNESSNYLLAVKLYESHPLIRRRYFRDLLKLKFQYNIEINPVDIYTGLLQYLSSIAFKVAELNKKKRNQEPLLEFSKLMEFSDWIEMKLTIWLNAEGAAPLQKVITIWNNKTSKPDPRNMKEWVVLLKDFHMWITKCWINEIGVERWTSEKSVLDIVNNYFKTFEVLRHAQPIWIEPQHLDIYLPELSLAIEYMGEQHYSPVEYFGGNKGFQDTVSRDQRKAEICKKAGIDLVYIRFDDNIKKKIEEIKNSYA